MMCARYFVPSRSTLSQMILDTSPYLRETFTVGMQDILCMYCIQNNVCMCINYYFNLGNCDQFSSSVKCQHVALPGYNFKNWSNSAHDRWNMFNYGFKDSPFSPVDFS